MKYLIRADGGQEIGGGHIMRCLSLIEAIRLIDLDSEVHFVCCELVAEFGNLIESKGIVLHKIPKEESVYHNRNNWYLDISFTNTVIEKVGFVDWLIVDHYKIDKQWESNCLSMALVGKLLVIDDLADREHDCHMLLDQTYGVSKYRYASLVDDNCDVLLGTEYALLSGKYAFKKNKILGIRSDKGSFGKLFVSLGASDLDNYSDLVVDQALSVSGLEQIYLVIGAANPHRQSLTEKYTNNGKVSLLYNLKPEDMIYYMLVSDVAIGAGGTSAWERCACGLPGLVIVMAENQREIANQLDSSGAMSFCDENRISLGLNNLLSEYRENKQLYIDAALACIKICDGIGAMRVARKMVHNE